MYDDNHVFTTADEFRVWLQKKENAAHRGLHEHQASITYGSHWVRFVDLDAQVIEFGRVLTQTDLDAFAAGGETERESIRRVTDDLSRNNEMVLSVRHSRLSTDDLGYAHRSHLWPIEPRLFDAAVAVDFDYRKFDEVARFLLNLAFASMKAHVMTP